MRKASFAEHQLFKGSQPLDISGLASSLQSLQVVGSSISEEQEAAQFEAWKRERLGKITGSRFDEVLKLKVNRGEKKVGDWSDVAMSLLFDLLGEALTGKPSKNVDVKATQWGNENEAGAIDDFLLSKSEEWESEQKPIGLEEFAKNEKIEVSKCNLIYLKGHKFIGTTPDGIIKAKNEVIEVKCPFYTKNHLRTIFENKIPDHYMKQCLGHLLVTECQALNFISFDPRIKGKNRLHVIRLEREQMTFALDCLKSDLIEFEKMLIEYRKKAGIKNDKTKGVSKRSY